ncbi:MAG: hypothetical protein AB1649_13125, partial [Chloroflexota bacterium]
DLRPFAIPLLIICVFQLFVTFIRYVFFTEGLEFGKLWNDLVILFLMVSISGLMLVHLGLLSGVRSMIDNLFNHNGHNHGHARSDEAHWID